MPFLHHLRILAYRVFFDNKSYLIKEGLLCVFFKSKIDAEPTGNKLRSLTSPLFVLYHFSLLCNHTNKSLNRNFFISLRICGFCVDYVVFGLCTYSFIFAVCFLLALTTLATDLPTIVLRKMCGFAEIRLVVCW